MDDFVQAAGEPAGRLCLRGHQALSRLSGPRIPQRRGSVRAATEAASRIARGFSMKWWPASAPRRGLGDRRPGQRRGLAAVPTWTGRPRRAGAVTAARYPYAFGGDGSGLGIDLTEPCAFLDLLASLDIRLVCISVGSPYYNPHLQRPALFPPSDGYLPPEDPLVGVARQIAVTAGMKQHRPGAGGRRLGLFLFAGMVAERRSGRGAPGDGGFRRPGANGAELSRNAGRRAGRPAVRSQANLCRTFSDCTTARATGWHRDAIRWIRFTSNRRRHRSWPRSKVERNPRNSKHCVKCPLPERRDHGNLERTSILCNASS